MKAGWKRLLAMVFAGILGLQLVACGSAGQTGNGAVQKEFVYVPEYHELKDVSWMNGVCASGDKIFFSTEEYDEEAMTSEVKIWCVDTVTKEKTEFPLQLTAEENDSGYIQQMNVNAEGNLVMVRSIWKITNPETYEGISSYELLVVSAADGSVLSQTDITDTLNEQEDGPYVQYLALDKDDNIYLSNGNSIVWMYDKAGQRIGDIKLSENSWMQSMGTTKEGKVVFITYSDTDTGLVIHELDPVAKAIGKTYKKNVPNTYGNTSIVPGLEKGILLNDESGVIEYDFETETATELFDWIDSDINRDSVNFFTALSDGRIFAITRDYSSAEAKNELVYLTKTPSSEIAPKEILTLGVLYASSDVNKAVIKFNKSNDKYRIQIINYNDDEDWEAGITRFNNEIASGNGPDIIDLSNVNLAQLASKGVFEDLNPYLDNDSELKREDYFEAVLNAYSIDGKLYSIPNSFYVSTVFGKTADVGETPGWTLDELMALWESKPEGTELFGGMTKDYILQSCLMYNFDSFIDWQTGECKLDSEEFIKVLEFANKFPEEYEYDEDAPSEPSKIQSGTQLLIGSSISNVQEYQMFSLMFGEPVTMIGYPSAEGVGNAIQASMSYAINAKSEYKDAAWAFLKDFITPAYYEEENVWSFPTLISAYDAQMKEHMTPEYYTDENGEQVEMPKTSWGWDDFDAEIYAAKQEDVDAVTELINNCDRAYTYDTQLMKIIEEEAAPFFSGQKSSKEAADIIQSRVKMYVNENR